MNFIHVVIPVYNVREYLQQAVNSVLNQPYKGIDIILVDDGSTDGSAELCDRIAAQKSRVEVIHQKNSGVSTARNAGIEYVLSNTDDGFIAFLDSDDLWNADFIDKVLVAEVEADDSTDVYLFGCVKSNVSCSRFSLIRQFAKAEHEGGNGIIWKAETNFSANLYRVSMLRKFGIRFIDGLRYSEDKIFLMQNLFLARNVKFMPGIFHIYRDNPTSATKKLSSYSSIEYYMPIIDGWISSDIFLNSFSSETGKTTVAGFSLAGIFFMEMSMDHYRHWRNPKRLDFVKSHPYYYLFENMKKNSVSKKQYKNQQLLLHRPWQFRLNNNVIGAVEFVLRLVLRIKPVHKLLLRWKYPLSSIPDSRTDGSLS